MNLDSNTIPPADQRPDQPNHRNSIVDMEHTLDTTNQLFLTNTLLSEYIDKINHAVDWLRSSEANAEQFKVEKNAVLSHLRLARNKFLTAHGVYKEKNEGQLERFYTLVEEGRAELYIALDSW